MGIIVLKDVVKKYVNHIAVDSLSFSIPEGSIFGLLGPNGAGKTTLIRIITQILAADSGEVIFMNEKLKPSHSKMIGYMPEERGLYKKMKVLDHLVYLARIRGLSKADAKEKVNYWLDKFGLADWAKKNVTELSKGMQQKAQFIASIIHEPKLLILDEPFSGLDPINTNLMKDEIKSLNNKGATIIFSTHRMEQVEEICDNILLINNGKKILEGKVADVKQKFKNDLFRIGFTGSFPENGTDLFEIKTIDQQECLIHLKDKSKYNTVLKYLLDEKL